MKKIKVLLLSVIIVLFSVLCLVGCATESARSENASKIKDIADIEKGFFPSGQMTSTATLDLNEYVDAKDTQVSYNVKIQDPSVANCTVKEHTLTLETLKGDAQTNVTVEVYSDGNSAFELSFTFKTRQYETIVCVGDSLTEGHDYRYARYSDQLQEMLGDRIFVKNYGQNGASVTGYGGAQVKYDTLPRYTESLACSPDLVLFMLGTNDATDWANAESTFRTEYEKLINSYLAIEGTQVMIVTSPPTQEGNYYQIPNAVIKEKVNPIQRSVAEKSGLPLADLRKAFEERSGGYDDLFRLDGNDGVHFTYEGGRFVAEFLKAEMEKL